MADGFFSARLAQLDENSWRIEDRGGLATLRWDDRNRLEVDFSHSSGVLGQRRTQESLYVLLDSEDSAPVVALKAKLPAARSENGPYLIQSRWRIWDFHRERQQFAFYAMGYGEGAMAWQVASLKRYAIQYTAQQGEKQELEAQSGPTGILEFRLPDSKGENMQVTVRQLS
jgi:hypothetical protein